MSFTLNKYAPFNSIPTLSFPPSPNKFLSIALCSVSLTAFAHTAWSQTTINQGETRSVSSLGSGDVTNNGTITFDGADTLSNTVNGTGDVVQSSGESATITSNNSYSGTTNISNGTLYLKENGSLPNSTVYGSEGNTTDISGITGDSASFKSLSGSQDLALGDKTLIITNGTAQPDTINSLTDDAPDAVDSGIFHGHVSSGQGGITIAGGTQAFYGANKDYSGNTTINQGATLFLGPLTVDSDVSKGLLTNSAIVNSGTLKTFTLTNTYLSEGAMVQSQSITNSGDKAVLDLGDALKAEGGIVNTNGSVFLHNDAQTTSIQSTKTSDSSVTPLISLNHSTVTDAINSANGNITLENQSIVGSITNTGVGNISLNSSNSNGPIRNENGNVTIADSSIAGEIKNSGGAISLDNSSTNQNYIASNLTNSNGDIILKNSSKTGEITNTVTDGKKYVVSIDNSSTDGSVNNDSGSISLTNRARVSGNLNNKNGNVTIADSSIAGEIKNSGGAVSLDNSSTNQNDIASNLTNSNGDIILKNSSKTGEITNTVTDGKKYVVSIDNSSTDGSVNNDSGSISLTNRARVSGNLNNKNGNVTIADSSIAGEIKNSGGAVSLDNSSTNQNDIASNLTNSNGDIILKNSSKTGEITNTVTDGKKYVVSIDNSSTDGSVNNDSGSISLTNGASVSGNLNNKNGNVTIADSSIAGEIKNSGGAVSLDNSSTNQNDIASNLTNSNGDIILKNSSRTGEITNTVTDGKKYVVSIDNSSTDGSVNNDSGSISLTNRASISGNLNNKNGNITLKDKSNVREITNTVTDGEKYLVSIDNSSTDGSVNNDSGSISLTNRTSISGNLNNKNGNITLKDKSNVREITNTVTDGEKYLVSIDNSSVSAPINNDSGSVSLTNAAYMSGNLNNKNGNVTLSQNSILSRKLNNENGNVSLNSSILVGSLRNSNGDVSLNNNSISSSITNTERGSISLDASAAYSFIDNENGNVTLNNKSQTSSITNTGQGNIFLDNSSVFSDYKIDVTNPYAEVKLNIIYTTSLSNPREGSAAEGSIKNSNGNVTLQNGSSVHGPITNGDGSVALHASKAYGFIANNNGNVALTDGSQANSITNTTQGNITLDNSRVSTENSALFVEKFNMATFQNVTESVPTIQPKEGSATDGSIKNENGIVTLQNGSTVDGDVTNGAGAVTMTGGSTVKGSVHNSGGDVTLDGSFIEKELTNSNGNITLQNASHAGDITSSHGNTSITQGSSAASLSIDHVALTLNDVTMNGDVSVHNTDNALTVGTQGASFNTLDMSNGAFVRQDLQGDLTVNSLKGNLGGFSGANQNLFIRNANGNTVTLASDNLFAQKKDINNGTVSVGDGASSGVIAGNLNVNGHVILDNNKDTTQSGTFSGDTDLAQNSTVSTTLAGDNSYTGDTHINAGSLFVDGNQSAAMGQTYVAANGTLGGRGTIGGSVSMAENSTLNPGSASDHFAPLTINKDLTMDKGSTLVINASSTPTGETIKGDAGVSYSRLQGSYVDVKGNASFNGNNFRLNVSGDPRLRDGQAYLIAKSDNVIHVTDINEATKNILANSNIVASSSFVKPVLININDPYLILAAERNNASFSAAATTHNGIATGHGMDTLPADGVLAQALSGMSMPEMHSRYSAFSGEVHASVRTALIQDSVYVRQAALDRLDSADCDGSASNGISTASLKTGRKTNACLSNEPVLWGRALGSLGHNSGDGNASTMHHSTAGFVMGLDAPVYDTWRVGGMIAYGHSMFNMGGATSSSGRSDNVSIGAYAGRHWGNLHLRLGASYTWNIMGMNRRVMAGSYSDRLNSNYMGGTAQGFGELAYKLHLGHKSLIEPFANVAYVNQQTDSYREHGGAAALAGKAMNTGVTFATFGARASTNVKMGRTLFTPHGSLAYRHAFGLTTPSVNQAFASTGARTGMGINGVPLSQDSAVIDAGISAKLSDRINVDLSYIGQYGNHSVDSGAQASVKTSF